MDAPRVLPLKKMPDTREEKYTREDRDLIIELKTQMNVLLKSSERLENAVKDIRDNAIARIEKLERMKAEESEIEKIYVSRAPKWNDYDRRIEHLDSCKLDKAECLKNLSRINKLENWRNYILGVLSVAGVIAGLITYIYFRDMGMIKDSLEKHVDQSEQILKNIK